MKNVKNKLNENNINYSFEIFGYDFMMDTQKNLYLIEINTNPGYEISSDLIKIIIPRMLDDALRLTVDEIFPTDYEKDWLDENKNYKSKFSVEGYDDKENMWEFVCDLNKNENCGKNGEIKKKINKKKKKHNNNKNKEK